MLRLLTRGGVYRELTLVDHATASQSAIQATEGFEDFELPSGPEGLVDVAEPAVTARYDHGRWVADCNNCAGAEAIDPSDARFYCFSCLTMEGWAQVILPEPAEIDSIEASLADLPQSEQDWTPS